MRVSLWFTAGSLAMLMTMPVLAAGGGHVVDDATVETPGSCHLESWVTLASHHSGFVNASPACTREAWPNLEIGGFVNHAWSDGVADTAIGLAPKLTLRSESTGLGIGLSGSIGYAVDRGRFETASLIMPVTIPAGERLRFNLNAGWQWARTTHRHDAFIGGQAEFALKPDISVMTEMFERGQGKIGAQSGLRWTTGKGRIDMDLLVGRYVDGVTPTALTIGITLRR